MSLQLAEYPIELVEKIIDLLPLEDIGCLTDVIDYAFQKYYSDVLILSGDRPKYQYIDEVDEISFGHLSDTNQMTKFDRVEYFAEFIKLNGGRYIPRNLSFESPHDFLKFGKQFPDLLTEALQTSISFEKHRVFEEMNQTQYRYTSLSYGYCDDLVSPAIYTLTDLTIMCAIVDDFYEYFSKFKNLESLKCGLMFCERTAVQALDFIPKMLKALFIEDPSYLPRQFKLELPNLESLELKNVHEHGTFDFSNLANLKRFGISGYGIKSLEELNLPPNLRQLYCGTNPYLKDVASVRYLTNLRDLSFTCWNSSIERFEFPKKLNCLSIIYIYDHEGDIPYDAWQDTMIQQLRKENFNLPISLRDLTIKAEYRRTGHSIPKIELPESLHNLTIEDLVVLDFRGWRFPSSIWNIKFSRCKIDLVDGVEWPYNLTSLDLHGNSFSNIGGLQYLKFLKYLHLQENKIANIGNLPSCLEYLDLSNNCLKSFDGSQITGLRDLILDNNSFEGILSGKILNLPDSLQVLKISHNKLTKVDNCFKFPTALKTLCCDVNHFGHSSPFCNTGPTSLWLLSLEMFQSDRCMSIEAENDIPKLYDASITFELCSNLSSVSLTCIPLNTIDWDLYPETLTNFKASCCGIQELKGNLRRLFKLYTLDLHDNSLTGWIGRNILIIPDSLGILSLCDNGLTKIVGIKTGTNPRLELDICGNESLDAESIATLGRDLSSDSTYTYFIYYEFPLVYMDKRMDNLLKLLENESLIREYIPQFYLHPDEDPDWDVGSLIGLAEGSFILD